MHPARVPVTEGITSLAYFCEEILRQRQASQRKTSLRRIYQQWFAWVEQYLPTDGPLVELGCGADRHKPN